MTVSPEFAGSTPIGTVTVTTSGGKLCVVKLSKGKGSCMLSRKKLPVGTYSLVANYKGTKNLATSASAPAVLTVVKAK